MSWKAEQKELHAYGGKFCCQSFPNMMCSSNINEKRPSLCGTDNVNSESFWDSSTCVKKQSYRILLKQDEKL